jgi:hypothetical protein
MDKYNVEYGTRAAQSYFKIYESAKERWDAGDLSHAHVLLLTDLHGLIDKVISSDPFNKLRLVAPLSRVYWASGGRLTILFAASPKPKTVVIICISTRPVSSGHHADVIIQKMIREGKVLIGVAPVVH